MQASPFLTNAIAQLDISELSPDEINASAPPHLVFSIEQLCGERDCVVIEADALQYAANARIDDTSLFTDALVQYARNGEEVFFEADYRDFCDAFPFAPAADVCRIGVLIIPSYEGLRFQTLTLLDDGSVKHDPYYMFLPVSGIEAARAEDVSENYSHRIFQAMEIEFPSAMPEEGSAEEALYANTAPISATLATVGISFLALKGEWEGSRGMSLPVIQEIENLPRIVRLTL